MGRRGYPTELRRRVLELVAGGRKVRDIAQDLGISDQTVYDWRRQEPDRHGRRARTHNGGTGGVGGCAAAHPRARAGAGHPSRRSRAAERDHQPKSRYAAVEVIVRQGLPAQLACRVLAAAESGYYARMARAPSPRAIRHAWITDAIAIAHSASHRTYGARRVHAELTLGQGMAVGREAVELLMRRAGLQGLSGRPRYRRIPGVVTAADRVDRQFRRDERDQLFGSPTSPSTRPEKARCTAPSSLMPGHEGSSDGRSRQPRTRGW